MITGKGIIMVAKVTAKKKSRPGHLSLAKEYPTSALLNTDPVTVSIASKNVLRAYTKKGM